MFVQRSALAAALVAVVALAGCTDNQGLNTAGGAVAGGLLGSTLGNGSGKTAAIIGGAALGGMAGSRVPTN